MRRPIDVVLPDTGPLITLAAADRLDLLTTFERPVLIPDVIREEALAKPGSPGHDRLASWFGGTGHNQFQIVATPLIDVYRTLRQQPNRPDGSPASKGMGEATLMWVMANIESLHARDTVCLVLTEDGRAGDQMPEDVHVLSTRSWLKGLQILKVIESVEDTLKAVVAAGRSPSRYSRDQRGRDAQGRRTDWTANVTSGGMGSVTVDQVDATRTTPVKLMVTRREVSDAIDAISQGASNAGSQGDPIVELLVAGSTAIGFKALARGRSRPEAFELLSGIRALTTLEQGFGGGEFRSVTVDLAQLDTVTPTDTAARARNLLDAALRKAAGRSIGRPSAEPPTGDKEPDGPGYR